jgi:hypothetical protein
MLHAMHYPRELLTERVTFTLADYAQIARCRGASHRLGLAYQLGFLRLTGRFPAQQPLEILHDGPPVVTGQFLAVGVGKSDRKNLNHQ